LTPIPLRFTFIIYRIEQDWLIRCHYNATGWGIVFIRGMVLRSASTLSYLSAAWYFGVLVPYRIYPRHGTSEC